MRRSITVAAVVAVLASAGFAVASIASGSSVLSSETTVTATTATTVTVPTTTTVPGPGRKVTICHYTHSKKHPFVTITVSPSALFAHFKHHDLPGPCTSAKIKLIVKNIKAANARAKHHGR